MAIERKYKSDNSLKDMSEDERVTWIQMLADQPQLDSPLDVNLARALPVELPPLEWIGYNEVPKKMKLKNTGHTVQLSATYHKEIPYVSRGPLLDDYVFSQLHFHWGANPMEGSEHTVDKCRFPMEMHVVHFKRSYGTHANALTQKDGIVVLVYFFKIQASDNIAISSIIDSLQLIVLPETTYRLPNIRLDSIVKTFRDDYYMYWGPVVTSTSNYLVLWLIDRTPNGMSACQLKEFLNMVNGEEELMLRNFREVVEVPDKRVFHVNRSVNLITTLFQIPAENFML